MAKKKTKKTEEVEATKNDVVMNAEPSATKLEEERKKAIAEFNLQNAGKFWIDPDRVPTDEDIKEAQKDFEERTNALQNKNDYLIADKTNALRVAKFMKEFNDNSVWQKRMFVGVINFSAEMEDFIEKFDENNPVDLVLSYGPMQYAFLMFENYGGRGIEDAKHMAEIWEEYLPIYETLHELIDWYKNEVDMCEKLKSRWGMFEQGYYLCIMDEDANTQQTEETETESK